jgi:hypothetical protein
VSEYAKSPLSSARFKQFLSVGPAVSSVGCSDEKWRSNRVTEAAWSCIIKASSFVDVTLLWWHGRDAWRGGKKRTQQRLSLKTTKKNTVWENYSCMGVCT